MRALVMAGGSGDRLFPLSTDETPKQFVKIFDGKSLFQKTLERASLTCDDIVVVTLEKYTDLARKQAEEVGMDVLIVGEPAKRNTLAAIAYGMRFVDDKAFILPSDHVVEVNERYFRAVKLAERASDENLVLFGITPYKPHTGYGYIQPEGSGDVSGVLHFKEKPDLKTAKEYVEKGYYWNSGMFVFDKEVFVEELKKYAPQYLRILEVEEGKLKGVYSGLPELSVDYGLLEHTDRLSVVKMETYWSDLGSFDSLYEYFPKDENENVVLGSAVLTDVERSLIISLDRTVVVGGLRNAVFVAANGVTLITRLGSTQKVKEMKRLYVRYAYDKAYVLG